MVREASAKAAIEGLCHGGRRLVPLIEEETWSPSFMSLAELIDPYDALLRVLVRMRPPSL